MSTTKYIVAKNEKVGRLARANCDLKPGEIILDEVPFVVGPKAGTFNTPNLSSTLKYLQLSQMNG